MNAHPQAGAMWNANERTRVSISVVTTMLLCIRADDASLMRLNLLRVIWRDRYRNARGIRSRRGETSSWPVVGQLDVQETTRRVSLIKSPFINNDDGL